MPMMSDTEDPKPLRILVVDDVDLNRVLARAFLTRMGHQVEEADSGASAIGRMHEAPAIDLMLLDINMPELSGEEVCLLLRKNPQWVSLKIIAYTAHAGSLDQERYLANGFDSVLVKPISFQRLQDAISAVLAPSAPGSNSAI